MHLPVLIFLHIVSCYSFRVLLRDVRDLTDLEKQKADSPNRSLLFLGRDSTSADTFTLTPNITTSVKKLAWRVGQVTDQYDQNMLWRKTNTFVNMESNTLKQNQTSSIVRKTDFIQEIPILFSSIHPLYSSTPSSIEFYYSYETDEQPQSSCVNANCYFNNTKTINVDLISSPNSSFLLFHISGPRFKKKLFLSPPPPVDEHNMKNTDFSRKSVEKPVKLHKNILKNKNYLTSPKSIDLVNTGRKNKLQNKFWKSKLIETTPRVTERYAESTTENDKIKFFEMYDKQTPVPFFKKSTRYDNNQHDNEKYDNNVVQKILLKHVDQSSHEHNVTKFSKKHIARLHIDSTEMSYNTIMSNKTLNLSSHLTERQYSKTSFVTNRSPAISKPLEYRSYSYENKTVLWSEYPFAAVYIHEPSQVHCDAASISAHWLVTSGSCLSRLNQGSPVLGEEQSAFIAYCGDRWWQPERIAYVKYSLVHPSYHPRDRTRKHLYNIGVIQVVTSMMSACSGWAPVTLMSHQFAANPGGSEALALGWGLDRYDTRYADSELPKAALMAYKGLVFSDSCAGNIGYSLSVEEGVGSLKYVYCLSLPPYLGEETDPVHGSLLFVGGKLIALYLQEERRRWGEQSAQYTGIWRLIPWVMEVAKEPDEMELFSVEI